MNNVVDPFCEVALYHYVSAGTVRIGSRRFGVEEPIDDDPLRSKKNEMILG